MYTKNLKLLRKRLIIKWLLIFLFTVLWFLFFSCKNIGRWNEVLPQSQNDSLLQETNEAEICFFIISDFGRNGYYYQRDVANAMGEISDIYQSPDFIITCGDNFQVNGVASTTDPLWNTSFENVYSHPSLLVDWYPVLGNHDYKGNTQAEIEYSKISRRWRMPDRYYSIIKYVNDSVKARFIFIDTPPLIEKYQKQTLKYPDASKQDTVEQIKWLKNVLKDAKEDWIFAFGHHPVYSASKKHGNTPELIDKLKPLFEKYGVDIYFCGHDHDFQHLKPLNSNVEYIVTGTGATVRESNTNENSVFSLSEPGFTLLSITDKTLSLFFINKESKARYYFEKKID